MISLSLLSTAHPLSFQPKSVRPFTRSYPRFSLAMDSSPGFGSAALDWNRPIQTRFRFGSLYAKPRQAPATRWPVMQKVRRHRTPKGPAPTACKRMVSGTISLPLRGTFHLSLTVLVHYRSPLVFSLAGWSPRIRSGFHVSGSTQVPNLESLEFRLRDFYPLRSDLS